MTSRVDRRYPIAVGVIAVVAAAAYLWAARNGTVHNYYTPAAVSMSQSLSSFLFGAYDSSGFAGIDKIPGALWPQAASVAVFGYSTWAILVPEAIASALTVILCYLGVARWLGRPTGLAAAAVYATTPLVVALAQTNVPEPWFALCLAAAAYLALRAVQSPGRGLWWLMGTGLAIGAAFQVKMLEAWILVPAVFVPYLVAARPRALTRLWHVVATGVVTLAASLWWVLLISAVPSADRPWVGGSNGDSAWEMVFGYNGLGRFGIGSDRSFVADFAGSPGLSRLIGPQLAVDVGWFLPLAALALVIGLVVTWRRPRLDVERAGYLLFGLWLVPAVLVMAFAEGIHTFYVLLYAIPVAALAAGGARQSLVWWRDDRRWPLITILVAQAAWTCWLVLRADEHLWVVAVVAAGALIAILGFARGALRTAVGAAAVALLIAPLVWAMGATGPVNAINPSAGPATMGGPGAGRGMPGNGSGSGAGPDATAMTPPPGAMTDGGPTGGPAGAMPGGAGATADIAALQEWLSTHDAGSRYLLATDSRTAGPLILAGLPGVMAMGGGFDGSDPTPTADELATMVAGGELRYVLQSGDQGGMPGPRGGASSATATDRSTWIEQNCTAVSDAPTSQGTLLDCASSP